MIRFISIFIALCLGIGGVCLLRNHHQPLTTLTLRVGYFANLTHMHALLLQALDRKNGEGLKKYLPEDMRIDWYRFNAGPSAMESLVTGNLDISYVGPSPALNIYMKTQGRDIRLLSGAVKGGSGLVLPSISDIFTQNATWENKKIATPQYGNTQDIACRAWFAKQNIQKIFMLPIANADQLLLFKKKQIDGVWTIEPWLSRILNEGGRLFYEDKDNWTTLLVGSQCFCKKHPELKEKILQAHHDLTTWIKTHPDEAVSLCINELKLQTNIDFPKDQIHLALQRLIFEDNVKEEELKTWIDDAVRIQFLSQDKLIPLTDFYSEITPKKD